MTDQSQQGQQSQQGSQGQAGGDQTHGVLLRGPQGHLFFVPHQNLSPFQVPEKGVDQMAAHLAEGATAAHLSIPTAMVLSGLCIMNKHGDSGDSGDSGSSGGSSGSSGS